MWIQKPLGFIPGLEKLVLVRCQDKLIMKILWNAIYFTSFPINLKFYLIMINWYIDLFILWLIDWLYHSLILSLVDLIDCLNDWLILDENYEDVLVNVNIMDTERTKKNLENIKSHAGYQAYDQEEVDELTGYIIIEISFFCGLIAFCFFYPIFSKKIVLSLVLFLMTCTILLDNFLLMIP